MKKLLVPILVLALVAVAVPVLASQRDGGDRYQKQECNVSLDGKVDLDKCVTIKQYRDDCYKTFIFECFEPSARADAEAVKNDLNKGNKLYIGAARLKDTMCDSFNYFNGIGQSNQSAGSMNNQGNVVSVAAVGNLKTYASALAAVGDTNTDNKISVNYKPTVTVTKKDGEGEISLGPLHADLDYCETVICITPSREVLHQTDSLTASFNGFKGIGQNNQSAGSMNNQNNMVAVAAGIVVDPYVGGSRSFGDLCKDAVAVSASELALNNTCNTFCVGKAEFTNTMYGSFSNFSGIGQSNQSAGNMNNQANVISVAASIGVNTAP
jgi:hypothetical protein